MNASLRQRMFDIIVDALLKDQTIQSDELPGLLQRSSAGRWRYNCAVDLRRRRPSWITKKTFG
jgi:hypothetical protein